MTFELTLEPYEPTVDEWVTEFIRRYHDLDACIKEIELHITNRKRLLTYYGGDYGKTITFLEDCLDRLVKYQRNEIIDEILKDLS